MPDPMQGSLEVLLVAARCRIRRIWWYKETLKGNRRQRGSSRKQGRTMTVGKDSTTRGMGAWPHKSRAALSQQEVSNLLPQAPQVALSPGGVQMPDQV